MPAVIVPDTVGAFTRPIVIASFETVVSISLLVPAKFNVPPVVNVSFDPLSALNVNEVLMFETSVSTYALILC